MAKKEIFSQNAPAPIGPYSQAIEANGMLFLSGQIAIDQETGDLVQDSLEAETHQVMKNIGLVLRQAGYEYSDIVKSSIFLRDMGYFTSVNAIYAEYLSKPFPARETVEVAGLPKNVSVEISVIACKS